MHLSGIQGQCGGVQRGAAGRFNAGVPAELDLFGGLYRGQGALHRHRQPGAN